MSDPVTADDEKIELHCNSCGDIFSKMSKTRIGDKCFWCGGRLEEDA